jgi:Tol biopolymer transport system component
VEPPAVTRLKAALQGRYSIEHELGEGGMATVYLAQDLKHERKVALKVLKPELAAVVGAERFLAEIKTTANLQHPHILPLHDSGNADGFLFYVMPYVAGETLRERLDREQQLPVDEAVRIATNVAEALDYAHRRGVIHRDIKPANILLQDGKPVLSDFGIALAVGAAGGGRLTETGLSLGTPRYMSPEQATGDVNVGPPADVYALGCVLYEMLAGDPPHTGRTAQAVLGSIITGRPDPVTKHRAAVPANVDAVIRRALEKVPADRFTSAQDVARELANPAFRHGEAVTGPGGVASRRWRVVALAGWATAAVLAVALGVSGFRADPPARVTRASIQLPPEEMWNPEGGHLELSPDGSVLVYRGVGEGGSSMLWVRRWDELHATPLPGSEQGWEPAISPDGTEVAFDTPGEPVYVVSLNGGQRRTVAEGSYCCPSWSSDGAWIYLSDISGFAEGATDQVRGVRRVPATGGGAVEEVTSADGIHGLTDPLPGDRGLLMAERPAGSDEFWVAVLDFASGQVTRLVRGTEPQYSPTGHVLYVDPQRRLIAAPFDLRTLTLTGPGIALADNLATLSTGNGFFSVSESGRIVYLTQAALAGSGQLVPVRVGRDGAVAAIDPGWSIGGSASFTSVDLSPDGRRLAVSIQDAEGRWDLWVKSLDRGPLSRTTFAGTTNFRATWSADGQRLTFPGDPAATGDLNVWTARADGTGSPAMVLDRDATISEAFYSPDGAWLIFREGTDVAGIHGRLVGTVAGQGDIFAVRTDDGTVVPLVATDFVAHSPTLSPDGRWLAYVTSLTGRPEVYVSPFPDTGSGRQQVSVSGGVEPVWAHSGRELFYRNGVDEMVAVAVTTGEAFRVEGEQILFPAGAYLPGVGHPQYDVFPDDQGFVMLQVAGLDDPGELILIDNWYLDLPERQ